MFIPQHIQEGWGPVSKVAIFHLSSDRMSVWVLWAFFMLVGIDDLNAQRYIDTILIPVAQPHLVQMCQNAVFQQDNARPHTARITTAHFQQQHLNVMKWPGCSPDFNPIEHVWDQLGRAVRARITPSHTLAHLRQFLQEEWDRLPQCRIQTLINSMRQRCACCIQARGGPTRYWLLAAAVAGLVKYCHFWHWTPPCWMCCGINMVPSIYLKFGKNVQ